MTNWRGILHVCILLAVGCESTFSHEDKVPPEIPQGLSVHPGVQRVQLVWQANTDVDFDHYVVAWGSEGLEDSRKELPKGHGPSSEVRDLEPGRTYHFSVAAADTAGNLSAFSSAVPVIPWAEDLDAPTVVEVVPANGETQVKVRTWVSIQFSEPMNLNYVVVSVSPAMNWGTLEWQSGGTKLKLEVSEALSPHQLYSLTVTGRDLADNVLNPYSFSFTTGGPEDNTPPRWVDSVPADQATNVNPKTALSLTFSEPILASSFELTVEPAVELWDAQWNEERTSVAFAQRAPFADDTLYTISVTATDLAGLPLAGPTSRTFTTAAKPASPPTLLSSVPQNGATQVPINVRLMLTFSEAMDKATVEGSFHASPSISCAWSWSPDATTAICTPSSTLAASGTYAATVETTAKDAQGTAMTSAKVISFQTSSQTDFLHPSLTASTPTGKGASRNASIVLTFSEAMDRTTVQSAFSVTSPTGVTGAWLWNAAGTVATFDPSGSFEYGAEVSWSLGVGAKDLAGNPLLLAASGSFQVIRWVSATLPSISGMEGIIRSDGTVLASTALRIGDEVDGKYVRSFLAFNLASLPEDLVDFTDATLEVTQVSVEGVPFPEGTTENLGSLRVDHVDFGDVLSSLDFATELIDGKRNFLSKTAAPGARQAIVLSKLRDDWENRVARKRRSQMRLSFDRNFTANTRADHVRVWGSDAPVGKPVLKVTYLAP